MAPGVLLEPYVSQGGQGVAETPTVSKGLSQYSVQKIGLALAYSAIQVESILDKQHYFPSINKFMGVEFLSVALSWVDRLRCYCCSIKVQE